MAPSSDIMVMHAFQDEQNATGDHRFIATVTREGKDMSIDIVDSYHQGVNITLHADGTWEAVGCGG